MSEDLKCVKLKQENIQAIIAALLLAASEEDHMASKYMVWAEDDERSGETRMAQLRREAAENCRRRAEEYRDAYGLLAKQ